MLHAAMCVCAATCYISAQQLEETFIIPAKQLEEVEAKLGPAGRHGKSNKAALWVVIHHALLIVLLSVLLTVIKKAQHCVCLSPN
jgi:ABC-type microcin C transport system permease subunit YejE